MSVIGLVAAVVMVLIVVGYLALPLLTQQDTSEDTFLTKQRERALAYYERVLRNIRDLDDDLATSKISQDEYSIERERWMARGTELLQMLEQLDQQQNINTELATEANDAEIDEAIEHAISGMHEQQTANEVS